MKTYARGRTSAEFVDAAKSAGLTVNTSAFKAGGDWVVFHGTLHDVPLHGLFNTVNSRVIGTFGADNANFSTDDSRDGTVWLSGKVSAPHRRSARGPAVCWSRHTKEAFFDFTGGSGALMPCRY